MSTEPQKRPGRPSLFTVDDLLRPDDELHNDQIREAYCRCSVAMKTTMDGTTSVTTERDCNGSR